MKITSFFKPKVPKKSSDEVEPTQSTSTDVSGSQREPDEENGEGIRVLSSGTLPVPVDIANMVGNKRATDSEKLAVINQKAPSVETLPYTEEGDHKRRFQPGWCSTYPWLKYSVSQKGGYCVACVLFAGDTAGTGGQTRLGTLVLQPMIKYKKATELLCIHNSNAYHKTAMVKMEQFVNTVCHPTRAIDAIIEGKRKEQIENNRRLLVPVIETVLFCGRNMLPLRGHRDDGPLDLTVPSTTGEGVFRALLRYRTQGGDSELKRLLTSTAKNSTLISKTIQDELISIAGE